MDGVLAACLCSECRQPWLTLLFNIILQSSEGSGKSLETLLWNSTALECDRGIYFFFLVKQDFSGIKNTSMNFSKLDHARMFSNGNSFPPPSQTG